MKRLAIAPLFALLLAAAAFGQSSAVAKAQRVTGDRFTVSMTTPKGARVVAVRRPSAAMLNAIDAGLTELFAVARRNGYRRLTSYGDYTIFIAKADRQRDSGGTYSPDIAVGAAQYGQRLRSGWLYLCRGDGHQQQPGVVRDSRAHARFRACFGRGPVRRRAFGAVSQ